MDVKAPDSLKTPIFIHKIHMLSAGPTNPHERILNTLKDSSFGVLQPEFMKVLEDVREGVKYIFQTKNRLTLVLSVSGNGGTEAVICNLLEDGDCLLIASSGFWGDRISEIAAHHDIKAITITPKTGKGNIFTFSELEEAIQQHKPKLLMIVHGESSTAVLQPLDGLADICHRYNCLLGVDGVISIGQNWMFMDRWNIDALYTGSQKGLGCPAGLSPISLSPRAEKVLLNRRKPVKPFYFDLEYLGRHFRCFGKEKSFIFHHTMNTNAMGALRESLAMFAEEGLENVIQRQYDCARRLYKGIEKLGLRLYVEKEEHRLSNLATICVPDDADWEAVVAYLMEKHSIEVGLGLDITKGKVLRIGFLGHKNSQPELVDTFLKALEEALDHCRELRRKGIVVKTKMVVV